MHFSPRKRQTPAGNAAIGSVAPPNTAARPQASPLHVEKASASRLGRACWPAYLRGSVILAAFCWIGWRLHQTPPTPLDGALFGIATVMMLVACLCPISRTRERILTFTAPVAFALLLWIGPTVAASAALLACLLYARFSPLSGRPRWELRFEGGRIALSLLISGIVLSRMQQLPAPSSVAVTGLLTTGFAALAFAAAYALSAILIYPVSLQTLRRSPEMRMRCRVGIVVFGVGMTPSLALAPLHAQMHLPLGLPLFVLLTLSALVARLYQEVASLQGQLKTAEEMGHASVAQPDERDPAVLLKRFLILAQDLVSADRAVVWLLDPETEELSPVVALPTLGPFHDQKARIGEGLIGFTAARRRPRRISDAAKDPARLPGEPAKGAWLLYPIIVHERLLGVAQWIRRSGSPFTTEDIARLDSLVPQAAVALENTRIREAMHNLASTDGLTGLWNHRKMHEMLRNEIGRAARYHRALSVLMLDVDSFKTFNDTYGHPQGDQLLRSIAAILYANIRNQDAVGRYGGEEFMVILPETSKDDACRLAERIRGAVEEQAAVVVEGKAIRRTVSVGVASYPEDALNVGDLVQCADDALYRAKRAGKNCVLWA